MKLLHSELHYYPDARRPESVRLGSLLFTKDVEEAGSRCVVGFYCDTNAVFEAQKLARDEFFAHIFSNFNAFIGEVAGSVTASGECSEEQIAELFIARLPHNLKANKPEPWPPARVFSDAARHSQPIMAFAIDAHEPELNEVC